MPSQGWDSDATACEPLTPTLSLASSDIGSLTLDINAFQWREDEAQKLLQTSVNPNEIRLLLSLFPFKDPDTSLRLLEQRYHATLNALLSTFQGFPLKDDQYTSNKEDKAIKILKIVAPDPQSSCVWDWNWTLPIPSPTTCASVVAQRIHRKISAAFSNVPFRDLTREACGYHSPAAKDLFKGVAYIQVELCRQFQELGQPIDEYKKIEEV